MKLEEERPEGMEEKDAGLLQNSFAQIILSNANNCQIKARTTSINRVFLENDYVVRYNNSFNVILNNFKIYFK